ncbi:MAG: hypothetical protein ACK45J_08510 [Acidimicrobiaceae bacterium]|jgi:hypothetical protein|nr:hypothetical protein [Ilumatobacteraceae bacterium]
MMKRLFWFVLGMCAGAYAVLWGKRKAAEVAESITPQAIIGVLLDAAKSLVRRLIALYNGASDDPPPSVL